jgi:hypothetical protein
MSNVRDAKIIYEYRQRQEARAKARLEQLGVEIEFEHYIGNSSFPQEYTLSYGAISATGPTFDLALVEFVKKLLAKIAEV